MARTRVGKLHCRDTSGHCKLKSSPLKSCSRKVAKDHAKTEGSKASAKKDWEDATCSVCLERPHNAVLLLCASYDKGCRPYMCATSCRFSNCLEQYKKAYTKVTAVEGPDLMNRSADDLLCNEKTEIPQLLCPLCRGQVKGWTVVELARKYLNAKKRMCMQEKCSFTGTYKQLRRHVKEKHPLARPRDVDPAVEAKWKKFERERERNDVISTIMSSTPGAVVLGDYVIEPGHHAMYDDDYDSDESFDDEDGFFPLESFDRGHRNNFRFRNGYHLDLPSLDEFNFGVRRRRVAPARLFVRRFRRPFESRANSRGRS